MTTSASPDPVTIEGVLVEADARWQRHVDILDWQPAHRIRGPEDPFTAAQEYAHHGHWIEVAVQRLRARLDGTEPPARITDFDAQNRAWAEADASRSHADAKAYATEMRSAYIEAARGPAATDDRLLAGVRFLLVDHVDQHFGYMLEGMWQHESVQWERMTAALDSHPRGRLHRGADGINWDATAIYAHLERWMAVQFTRVAAFLEGGEVPDLDDTTDALNARWMAEDDALKFEAARRQAYVTRDRFIRTLRDVPVSRWNARLVGLCSGNSLGHYQEHLDWIRAST